MLFPALFLSIFIFTSVWYILEWQFGAQSRKQQEREIKERIFSSSGTSGKEEAHRIEKRQTQGFLSRFFDEKSAFRSTLPLWLSRAKLPVSASFFVIVTVFAAIISFLVVEHYRPLIDAQIVAVIMLVAPFFVLKAMNRSYLKKFQQYFPDAITALSSSLKVGHGIEVGLGSAIDSSVYPVKEEFLAVQGELKLGIPTTMAFQNLYQRIPIPEVRIFWMGISIHEELGGNLSEVLDNLEKTIRTRFELEREINVLSSQGKFSVLTISLVPFIVAGALYLSDKKTFLEYLNSDMGQFVTRINIAAVVIGVLWMRKLVDLRD